MQLWAKIFSNVQQRIQKETCSLLHEDCGPTFPATFGKLQLCLLPINISNTRMRAQTIDA